MARKQSAGYRTVSIMLQILTGILAAVLIAWLGTLTYHFAYKIFADQSYYELEGVDYSTTVRIEAGSSAAEIGETLENAGVIADKYLFWFQITFAEATDNVKSGSYNLSSTMSADEIIQEITADSLEEETEESSAESVTAGSSAALGSELNSEGAQD